MTSTYPKRTRRAPGFRRRTLLQVASLAAAAVIVGGLALLAQYRTAMDETRGRLSEIVESRARTMEAVARFNARFSIEAVPGGPLEATLAQFREAHEAFQGFGETGEFTLASLSGDTIRFLLSHRHADIDIPAPVPLSSDLAAPMRAALAGRSGTMVGPDYRGAEVVAAFEPVRIPGETLGVVAKIDLAELHRPYFRTARLVALVSLVLVLVASWVVWRVAEPLIRRVEESERRYRTFFEESAEAMFLTTPDGHILAANASGAELLSCDPDDLEHRNIQEFWADPEARNAYVEWLRADGAVRDFPVKVRRDDGTELECLVTTVGREGEDGESVVLDSVIRDVTAQKEAERRVQTERDRARDYLEVAEVMMVALDADGRIEMINRKGCEILGYERGDPCTDLQGRDWFETCLPRTDVTEVREAFRQMMAGRVEPVEYHESHVRTRSGEERLIAWHNALRRGPDGAIAGTLGSGIDVTERRAAEEARVRAEQRTESILRAAPVGIGVVRDRVFTELNDGVSEMLGYVPEELLGKSARVIYPSEEEYERVGREKYGEIRERGTGSVETRWQRKDGEILDVILSSTPLDPADLSAGVVFTALDITERKQMEQRLRWMGTVAEQVGEGVAVADLSGHLSFVNQAWADMHGWTPEELVGKHLSLFHSDEQLPEVEAFNERVLLHGRHSGEVGHLRRDGTSFPTEMTTTVHRSATGEPIGLIGFATDITGRKESEEALRTSEARYRAVFENTGTATVIIEEDATISLANEQTAELSGYTRSEIEGRKRWTEFVVPEDLERMKEQHELRRKNREAALTRYEFTFRDKDGNLKEVLLVIDMIPGTGQSVASLLDITERKQMEDELRKALQWQESVVEGSRDAIFISDEDSRFVLVNSAAVELTGYPKEDLLQMRIPDLHEKVDLDAHEVYHDRIMAGEPALTKAKILRKDGTKVDTEFNNHVIKIGGVPFMHTVARDITAWTAAQESLRASEAKLKKAQRIGGMGFLDWDLKTNEMEWSEEVYGIYGVDPARETGTLELALAGVHPDDAGRVQEGLDRAIRGVEPYELDHRILRPDGEVAWVHARADLEVDEEGEPAVLLGTIIDITEHKRLEEERQREADINRELAELSQALLNPDLSLDDLALATVECARRLTGSEHGFVSSLDPQTGASVAHTLTEMLGRECRTEGEDRRIEFPPGPDGTYGGLWGHALNTGEAFYTNDPAGHPASRGLPEGHIPLGSFLAAPALIGGRPEGLVALAAPAHSYTDRDLKVTELIADLFATALRDHRRTQELVESRQSLRDLANRIVRVREEERVELARELHDELGQMVTVLRMDLSTIRSGIDEADSALQGEIADLMERLDGAADLIRDYCDRLRPPILDVLGVGAAIRWLAEGQATRFDADFRIEIGEVEPKLSSEEKTTLFRIAQEALTNVLRHSEAGEVRVTFRVEEDDVLLEVADDGVGIPREHLQDGTSLGLLGMRERAIAIGADLAVESEGGGGTVVRVRLGPRTGGAEGDIR